jgi:hypothetical protein
VIVCQSTGVLCYRLNDGVEIIEGTSPTLALRSRPDAEITSRPPPVRMRQYPEFAVGSVCVARVGSCHT